MVEDVKFYNGSFPARHGDRMSSVLEANYIKNPDKKLSGKAHISLMNAGLAMNGKLGKFKWNAGFRYSYPESFITTLQTQGAYHTTFSDAQIMASYELSEKSMIEFTGIYAENEFSLSPTKWEGNFGGFSRGDVRGMEVNYNGERVYEFATTLAGLKFKSELNSSTSLILSAAGYWTQEKEKQALNSDYYYTGHQDSGVHDFIKTRYEIADNLLNLGSYRLSAGLIHKSGIHTINSGIEYRSEDITSNINERTFEESYEHTTERPYELNVNKDFRLTSISVYAEDQLNFSPVLNMNLGLRYLRYQYSEENLFSPRISILYYPSFIHSFTLSWGYYYQPPHIAELKTTGSDQLKSQKAVHYALGWEYRIKENIKLHAEVYYKDLDNLIPYYFDDMRMVYTGTNSREGYSYGLDIMLETQMTAGLRTKFGYSFLNAKEKDIDSPMDYITRLAGQTHTVQIFLQDKFPSLPNIQTHLRFLWGSGNSFYSRKTEYDDAMGEPYIAVNLYRPEELFMYLRVDMGLSANFKIGENNSLLLIAEVLNVFDHLNYGSYNWIQILEEIEAPVPVPNVLSPRFLNLRAEFTF
jgi:outer membrane receptor protein involved in Fe transport